MHNHIRLLHKACGLTQATLADAMGVSRNIINAIEVGFVTSRLALGELLRKARQALMTRSIGLVSDRVQYIATEACLGLNRHAVVPPPHVSGDYVTVDPLTQVAFCL